MLYFNNTIFSFFRHRVFLSWARPGTCHERVIRCRALSPSCYLKFATPHDTCWHVKKRHVPSWHLFRNIRDATPTNLRTLLLVSQIPRRAFIYRYWTRVRCLQTERRNCGHSSIKVSCHNLDIGALCPPQRQTSNKCGSQAGPMNA